MLAELSAREKLAKHSTRPPKAHVPEQRALAAHLLELFPPTLIDSFACAIRIALLVDTVKVPHGEQAEEDAALTCQ